MNLQSFIDSILNLILGSGLWLLLFGIAVRIGWRMSRKREQQMPNQMDKLDNTVEQALVGGIAGITLGLSMVADGFTKNQSIITGILMFIGYTLIAFNGPGIKASPIRTIIGVLGGLGAYFCLSQIGNVSIPTSLTVSWISFDLLLRCVAFIQRKITERRTDKDKM